MQTNHRRIAVLISGSGSNLQAIIDFVQRSAIKAQICCVISNSANAHGLVRAKKANIPAHVISHTTFSTRKEFEMELVKKLKVYNINLVVLAGFMRVLSDYFIEKYQDKILNIHPSLLPKFPGLHTHQRAIDAGENIHGCSVHLVTANLDQGPLIMQAEVPVKHSDTPDLLAKRVLEKEHIIYPLTIKWLSQNKLRIKKGKIYFENYLIDQPVILSPDFELELK